MLWHFFVGEVVTVSPRRSAIVRRGSGNSPQLHWVRNIRDLACFYARFVREQGLTPVDRIGFSLGGWIAAERAVNDAKQFRRLVLVGATGIKPPEGEIADLFTVTARVYLNSSVNDIKGTAEFAQLYGGEKTPEQYEAWEEARAEAARIAWQPYMFNPSLPQLLEGVSGLPALLVLARHDRVVPVRSVQAYPKSSDHSPF